MNDERTLQEYQALTTGAGLARVERSLVVMTGRDRVTLLHKFCTQDVQSKQPGQGGEAFLCNAQGKIVAYVYFFVGEQALYLDSSPGQAQAIIAHLDRYVITEDVQFEDHSTSHADLLLSGAQVKAILANSGSGLPTPMYAQLALSLGGNDALARRVPFTGASSWLVSVARDRVDGVQSWLMQQGLVPCESAAVEIARVEAGAPLFGTDITVENLPQEIARDVQAINFRKGCYLGQETVARIDALGHVNKLLVRVKLPLAAPSTPGSELKLGEKVIGRVTSVVDSPLYQSPLALAYLRREYAAPGTMMDGVEVLPSLAGNL